MFKCSYLTTGHLHALRRPWSGAWEANSQPAALGYPPAPPEGARAPLAPALAGRNLHCPHSRPERSRPTPACRRRRDPSRCPLRPPPGLQHPGALSSPANGPSTRACARDPGTAELDGHREQEEPGFVGNGTRRAVRWSSARREPGPGSSSSSASTPTQRRPSPTCAVWTLDHVQTRTRLTGHLCSVGTRRGGAQCDQPADAGGVRVGRVCP